MNKVLITGSTGMVGSSLSSLLCNYFDVYTTSTSININQRIKNHLIFDLKTDDVNELINWSQANTIIHCGAITNIDYCEKNKKIAKKVNFEFIKKFIELNKNIRIIFISSDAVFSEKKSSTVFLNENSQTKPLNYYGKLKLMSENEVLKNKKCTIIRCTPVGLNINKNKESFSEKIIKSLLEEKKINLFDDVFFTPISIWRLSREILSILQNNTYGVYNLSPNQKISKYEFGIRLSNKLKLESKYIVPGSISNIPNLTPRLKDQSLISDKYIQKTKRYLGNIESQLDDFKENFDIKYYKN